MLLFSRRTVPTPAMSVKEQGPAPAIGEAFLKTLYFLDFSQTQILFLIFYNLQMALYHNLMPLK